MLMEKIQINLKENNHTKNNLQSLKMGLCVCAFRKYQNYI